jgi:hypothetical protein
MIDPLSVISLAVLPFARGNQLGQATAFGVERNNTRYLITNWHVVAGRHAETGEVLSPTGAIPDELRILFHGAARLGTWIMRSETLYDGDGRPRWVEHAGGREIDVVALPLSPPDGEVAFYPFDLNLADADVRVGPATEVSIIGFPLGIGTEGQFGFPIWKTGHIASDPDLDYGGQPAFLVDATTREGMSGSPVVRRAESGYVERQGGFVVGPTATRFLGIYSGRICQHAELGRLWRPQVLIDLLQRLGN